MSTSQRLASEERVPTFASKKQNELIWKEASNSHSAEMEHKDKDEQEKLQENYRMAIATYKSELHSLKTKEIGLIRKLVAVEVAIKETSVRHDNMERASHDHHLSLLRCQEDLRNKMKDFFEGKIMESPDSQDDMQHEMGSTHVPKGLQVLSSAVSAISARHKPYTGVATAADRPDEASNEARMECIRHQDNVPRGAPGNILDGNGKEKISGVQPRLKLTSQPEHGPDRQTENQISAPSGPPQPLQPVTGSSSEQFGGKAGQQYKRSIPNSPGGQSKRRKQLQQNPDKRESVTQDVIVVEPSEPEAAQTTKDFGEISQEPTCNYFRDPLGSFTADPAYDPQPMPQIRNGCTSMSDAPVTEATVSSAILYEKASYSTQLDTFSGSTPGQNLVSGATGKRKGRGNPQQVSGGQFEVLTSDHSEKLMNGVAKSGSDKTRARRKEEADKADREREYLMEIFEKARNTSKGKPGNANGKIGFDPQIS